MKLITTKKNGKLNILTAVLMILLAIVAATAQEKFKRSPVDPRAWSVVYDAPATGKVKIRAEIPYFSQGGETLKMDVYSPPVVKSGKTRPAIIFVNGIGDAPDNRLKDGAQYQSWARLVAAHGFVGVTMEADALRIQDNLRALFGELEKNGAKYGIDGSRLGVFAVSANTVETNAYLMSDDASRGIRGAVLYYGNAPAGKIRADLPVLFVVAETDAPGQSSWLPALWQRTIEARAPWTLTFASRLPHAFDIASDTDAARRLIQQTVAFWKSHLEPVPQPGWKPSAEREIVAAIFSNDPLRTAEMLAKYTAKNPTDAEGYVHYGNALRLQRKLDEASAAYERALALKTSNLNAYSGLAQVRAAQKKWGEAADFFARAIEGGNRAWFMHLQLAGAHLQNDQAAEAAVGYETALRIGVPPGKNTRGAAYYNLGCARARLGQKETALDALEKAVENGFNDLATFEKDEDLAPLRAESRFRQLITRLEKK